MNVSKLQPLFEYLLKVRFDPAEKPSQGENLTDILEIVAVATGIKLAHLNGQGFRSECLLGTLEEIAKHHGLLTMRTNQIKGYKHRKSKYDDEIYLAQKEMDEHERLNKPDVLWIYKDPSLRIAILDTANGAIHASRVLGYPECCVMHDLETDLCVSELLIEGLKRTYNPQTTDEYIELLKKDVKVEVNESALRLTRKESAIHFPYVQFSACPDCLQLSDTPAAKINRIMRDLAFCLSEPFGREIWKAQYKDFDYALLKCIGRNDPCPCSSGKTYKMCCG